MSNITKPNITYFEFIKLINEIFPSKAKLDYTKLTANDLISRMGTIVVASGYKFSDDYLLKLEKIISAKQTSLPNRTDPNSKKNDTEFDQYDYKVQSSISAMHTDAINRFLDFQEYKLLLDPDSEGYTANFGDLETLNELFMADNIAKYIKDVLEVTGYDKNKFLTYDARMMASEEIEKTVKELNRELDTQILKEQKKSDQILKELYNERDKITKLRELDNNQ